MVIFNSYVKLPEGNISQRSISIGDFSFNYLRHEFHVDISVTFVQRARSFFQCWKRYGRPPVCLIKKITRVFHSFPEKRGFPGMGMNGVHIPKWIVLIVLQWKIHENA